LVRTFEGRKVLDGLDFDLAKGEFVAVVGRSGVGKSTMLGILGTHDLGFEGRLSVGGTDVPGANGAILARIRREYLGYVFQDFHLLPSLTALENAILPAVFAGSDSSSAEAQAREVLDHLGVRIDDTPTAVLSRGERQRVAVARGLVNRPKVLLADEPSASLDDESERILFDMLDGLRRGQGFALVAVVHSTMVLARADRVLELREGRLHATA
jgi:ABC-type lipoprotein export system ATPase subunit